MKPICVAALLGATGAAQAAITFYITPASFLAAVGQTGVDRFSELNPFSPFIGPPLPGSLARSVGPFSYNVNTTTGELRAGLRSGAIFGGESQIWLESFRTQDTLISSDFSSGVASLGGNFFNTCFGGSVGAGVFGGIGITARDADGIVSVSLGNTSLSSFVGVVSTTGSLNFVAAQSVRFFLESIPGTCRRPLFVEKRPISVHFAMWKVLFLMSPFTSAAVDNLILATAVPEPQTYAHQAWARI